MRNPARPLASLCLALLFLGHVAAASPAVAAPPQDPPGGFLETFALAADRAATLEALLPGSEDEAYFRCLHAQNTGDLDAAARLLAANKSKQAKRWDSLRARQTFLAFDPASEASWETLTKALALTFDHAAEAPDARQAFPSRLDPAELLPEAWMRRAMAEENGVKGLRGAALESAVGTDLSRDDREYLLANLPRPDVPGLVELVVADLQQKRSKGFGSRAVHELLLLDQLEACAAAVPGLRNDSKFVSAWVQHLKPRAGVDLERDRGEQLAFLERLEEFLAGLPPGHLDLRAHVGFHRLRFELEQDTVSVPRLLRYLDIPRDRGLANRRDAAQSKEASLRAKPLTGLPAVRSDTDLLNDCFDRVLAEPGPLDAFAPYFRASTLEARAAEAKLLAGTGDPESLYAALGGAKAFAALEERVELGFAPHCPQTFGANAAVALDLDVKNVPQLIVQVYALEPLHWYLSEGKEVSTGIDLHGLQPGFTQRVTFEEPSVRRVRRRFDLDAMQEPGMYIVEFVGAGKSCRALIRKGGLDFLERRDAAGHALRVIDEQGTPLSQASIWLGGREYVADQDGQIRLPYTIKPGPNKIILAHGGRAALTTFERAEASYRLDLGWLAPLESLVPGKQTQLVLRPELYVNDQQSDPAQVTQPRLRIQGSLHSGPSFARMLELAPFRSGAEVVVPFDVPEGLKTLSVQVLGSVRNLALGTDQELTSPKRLATLSNITSTIGITAPLLRRFDGGYALEFRGRSGELRPGEVVRLRLHHRDFVAPLAKTLISDARGRILLGPLPGIERITSDGFHGARQRWSLDIQAQTPEALGLAIHGLAGVPLRVALPAQVERLDRSLCSILERRGNRFVRDVFPSASLEDGALVLRGLTPGDYSLHWRSNGWEQHIRIADGPQLETWTIDAARKLELDPRPRLGVASIDQQGEDLIIQLVGAPSDARVHVFAQHFLPRYDLAQRLDPSAGAALELARRSEFPNRYATSRRVSDEQRYVLERRFRRAFPGNMLGAKPGLLLNDWAVLDTDRVLRVGGGAGAGSNGKFGGKSALDEESGPKRDKAPGRDATLYPDLTFLSEPVQVLTNLRPDDQGRVRLARSALGAGQHVVVLAADAMDVVRRDAVLPEGALEPRDLRLDGALDRSTHSAVQRSTLKVLAGTGVQIQRTASARADWIGTLDDAFGLFRTLSHDSELERFAFLAEWPIFDPERKRALYSEFACHELHLFLSRKDRVFFEEVVRPYLRNKGERTFLDHWLLDEPLDPYLQHHAYRQLNALERILLAARVPAARAAVLRWANERVAMQPLAAGDEAALFERALAQGAPSVGSKRGRPTGGPGGPSSQSLNKPERAGAAEEEELSGSNDFFLGRGEGPAASARLAAPLWTPSGPTAAHVERHYWNVRLANQGPDLVRMHPFWLDLAEHLTADPATRGPFLSPHLARAAGNTNEVLLALAFLDLPFETPEPVRTSVDDAWSLVSSQAGILLRRELTSVPLSNTPLPLAITQDVIRLDDRYEWVRGTRGDKFVTDELQSGVAYATVVTVTNPAPDPVDVQVLIQVPAGAVPLGGNATTAGQDRLLPGRSSQKIEVPFYFPQPGDFEQYGAQVIRDGTAQAFAASRRWTVAPNAPAPDPRAWSTVAESGSTEQVLAHLESANLQQVDLGAIAWRLGDEGFYNALARWLDSRLHYDARVGAYGVLHRDLAMTRAYLRFDEATATAVGGWLRSPLLDVDPFESRTYQEVELSPLIQSRAHVFGDADTIEDRALRTQWMRLLRILAHKPSLEDSDRLSLASYLVLQGRIEEALMHFEAVTPDGLRTRLQYDYMAAYMAFFGDDPESARALADRYTDHPVERWRQRFAEVIAHLDEAAGTLPDVEDANSRIQRLVALAGTGTGLDLNAGGGRMSVESNGVDSVQVRYYAMDIEQLFSRSPFQMQSNRSFGYVRPGLVETWQVPEKGGRTERAIPTEYADRHVLIEVRGGDQVVRTLALSGSLSVKLSQSYGILRVSQSAAQQPVRGAYVKVFAKDEDGRERFHKDGYTDLRGRFDYASVTQSRAFTPDRFSILVLAPSGAAVTREVNAPLQ